MPEICSDILKSVPVEASAPCRMDMGGTLDIKTFYLAMNGLSPCTVNAAISLRTRVRIQPFQQGRIMVSSTGFDSVTFPSDAAPFDHPLGLIFAIAAYFGISGVHIDILSDSPPRSALGGSSAAAVAQVAALARLREINGSRPLTCRQIVLLAHAIEESVAGVPCGFQDQLAAVYGGVHSWYWQDGLNDRIFHRKTLVRKPLHSVFARHILLAYCGIPHESRNINSRWVKQFISGSTRKTWKKIVDYTHQFSEALSKQQYHEAGKIMNAETALRREMTPDVLDHTGVELILSAQSMDCGARFTGAGGGGCIWAIGKAEAIGRLHDVWEDVLGKTPDARLLEVNIDADGLIISSP